MLDGDLLILSIQEYISSYNLLCMFHWCKDVMKQPINLYNLYKIEEVLKILNLNFVLSDFFYENPNEWCFWKDKNKIIYIWFDREKCLLVKKYDEHFKWEFYINHKVNKKYTYKEATIGNGNLLWYPECCINSFITTDNYDYNLFYVFSSKVINYKNCNNFLNVFEYIILHNIPCSFECKESINLAKKMLPYFIKSHCEMKQDSIINDIFSKKTYILFKSANWIKLQKGKITFWSILNINDSIYIKTKQLLTNYNFNIDIIDSKKIFIFNNDKWFYLDDVQVFIFPEIKI